MQKMQKEITKVTTKTFLNPHLKKRLNAQKKKTTFVVGNQSHHMEFSSQNCIFKEILLLFAS